MKTPLITIITVCYNSAATIKNTIESVLNQSHTNIEYILIDGFSTDNTLAIIKSYESIFQEKKIAYKWISEPDKGIYDAFNKGIKLATGKWISFLGSDDYYLENALALYAEKIADSQEEYDLVYSKVQVEDGKIFKDTWSWNRFRRKMHIAHVGALQNKEYFKKYGLFDTSYAIAGDYELLLRAKEKLKTLKLEELTVIMSKGGISNTQIIKTYKETTRAKLETAGVSKFSSMLDYYLWVLKYKVKIIINAIFR